MRIGKKFGNVFFSLGKSGIYSSTWLGEYRLSHFNRFKKSKDSSSKKQALTGDLDFEIGDWLCVVSGILVPVAVWWMMSFTGWILASIIAWALHIGVVMYIQHNMLSDPNDTLILSNKLWLYPFILPAFLLTNPVGWVVTAVLIFLSLL